MTLPVSHRELCEERPLNHLEAPATAWLAPSSWKMTWLSKGDEQAQLESPKTSSEEDSGWETPKKNLPGSCQAFTCIHYGQAKLGKSTSMRTPRSSRILQIDLRHVSTRTCLARTYTEVRIVLYCTSCIPAVRSCAPSRRLRRESKASPLAEACRH